MSVSTTNSIVADATNTKSTSTSATSTTDAQDRFLKLLVTQMQNQDPLNPMDNAQVTSQMAQISTVSGIQQLNQTLQTLNTAYTASQTMQSATMIGHNVLAEGNVLSLASGSAIGGVDLASNADSVTVKVYDSAGTLVHTDNLGAQKAGSFAFKWDGSTDNGQTAADGTYNFKVSATQGGSAVDATALGVGTVGSVTLTSTGAMLNVDTLGAVSLSQVRQIM